MELKYKYKPNPDLPTSQWTKVTLKDHLRLFTGMIDANGEEIYDGDILQDSAGCYCYVDYSSLIGAFVMVRPQFITTFDMNILQQLIVVGNIDDNLELVKDFIDKRKMNNKIYGI